MKKPPDLDGFFVGNYRSEFSRTVPITIGNTDYTEFFERRFKGFNYGYYIILFNIF